MTQSAKSIRFEPPSKLPAPQCATCSRFVDVKTARAIPEVGDYGAVLSVEYQCRRCVEQGR